jgi:glycosyltransferase involved in cell wall biosynthesis
MSERSDEKAAPVLAPAPAGAIEPSTGPPTISVVIPVYEGAKTIGDAIESVLAQEPPPLEVIVSDDGSTDALDRALAPYVENVKVVRHPHRGVAAARNAGWSAASGDFILFSDADDLLLDGKLAALGRLGRERPDLDLLCTDMYFERDGRRAGRFGEVNPFPIRDQRTTVLERCFVVQPAFRRSRLLEIGGFDETLPTGEDWDCVLRLILDGSSAGLWDEPLAVYRINSGSLTHARPQTLGDRVRLLEKALENPGLRKEERPVLESSLLAQRSRARLAATQAAIAANDRDVRRRCLELASTRGIDLRTRVYSLAFALLPAKLRPSLSRRLTMSSELSRSLPSEP